MLNGPMLHPELLGALGRAGHSSKILIGDGNYPSMNAVNPSAERVYLNLAPGLLSVGQILAVVKDTVPIEEVAIMVPCDDATGAERPDTIPAHDEYRETMAGIPFAEIKRWDFYDAAKSGDVTVFVQSADQRLYANVLLTVGVRT
ncbi:MAG TPA: RbsD/FucU family protein [Arachnia sp.]|nr:RbsD/FucU family protein [Arachnia sp.]HMT87274.1 RbsD/FucU family protein [Arachnia sp.]